MSGRKEGAELARQYEQAGYRIEKSGGHYKVLGSDGRFVTTFASTPGSARSARVDRIRQRQVLRGELPVGRRHTRRGQDGTVADASVAPTPAPEIPAAFRKTNRRAHGAEMAAREAAVLGRAGSLDGIRDVGDLFASVTPAPGVMDPSRFAEAWDKTRRNKAEAKQKKRAGKAENWLRRQADVIYREKGFVDVTALPDRTGTCIACLQPCVTVFSPSFAAAEGHIVFLEILGIPQDGSYAVFRSHWNEAHPLFQMDDGQVPMDWQIAGIQIPTRVCQECFDNLQKVAWGGCKIRLRDYPAGNGLYGIAYDLDACEDGPVVLERNKAIAAAAMRVEQAVVSVRETGETAMIQADDVALLESAGFRFPPGIG